MRLIDLSGMRFGRLVVSKRHRGATRKTEWECKCDCGQVVICLGTNLKSGNSASCGCLKKDTAGQQGRTHGRSDTPTYRAWKHMRQRCLNPKVREFKHYGGRGISICKRWESFQNFLADMGERPSSKFSLDRKDNEGNYTPGNCRWATTTQQRRNRRSSRLLTFKGETHCVMEWAEITGIDRHNIENRLRRGWPLHLALTVKSKHGQCVMFTSHKNGKPIAHHK